MSKRPVWPVPIHRTEVRLALACLVAFACTSEPTQDQGSGGPVATTAPPPPSPPSSPGAPNGPSSDASPPATPPAETDPLAGLPRGAEQHKVLCAKGYGDD